MSSADPTPDTEQQAGADDAPAIDPRRQVVLDTLTAELGEAVVGSDLAGDDVVVRVAPDAWLRTAEVCRDQLEMDYFCFLSGLDWMPSAANPEEAAAETEVEGEDDDEGGAAEEQAPEEAPAAVAATPEAEAGEEGWATGVAGGETRFQVLARLYSTRRHVGVTLKADLDEEAPQVASWTPVYRGADWHERETWEMYGFDFVGHPQLEHLYLPAEFEGHPLRKDFPLLSREVKPWPGLVDVEIMPPHLEAAAEAALNAAADGEGENTGGGES